MAGMFRRIALIAIVSLVVRVGAASAGDQGDLACPPAADSQEIPGLGAVEWEARCHLRGSDSLERSGRLLGPTANMPMRGVAPEEIRVRWVFPRRGTPATGALPWGRWRLGPYDSLRVEGGTLRAAAGRKFDLEGSLESLRLVALKAPRERPVDSGADSGKVLDDGIRPGGDSWLWTDGSRARSVKRLSVQERLRAVFDSSLAPILARNSREITFAVDPVEVNRTPARSLTDSAWKASWIGGMADSLVWVAGRMGGSRMVAQPFGHAFAGAFLMAWNEHRPVRLSPDAVWMLLMGPLLERVEGAPESCKSHMVRSVGGKDTVRVVVDGDFPRRITHQELWREIADKLLDSMDRKVVEQRHRSLIPRFSTTTSVRALSQRLRVLQLYKSFFVYDVELGCGIPSITLEGTPDDWRLLRERVGALGICGMEGWVRRMEPVLDQFVDAAQGRPSLDFWRSFVRYQPVDVECGTTSGMDGWITAFFPPRHEAPGQFPWVGRRDIVALGLDRGYFDLSVRDSAASTRRFKLMGGFSGVAQTKDGALQPELGWTVWEVFPKSLSDDAP